MEASMNVDLPEELDPPTQPQLPCGTTKRQQPRRQPLSLSSSSSSCFTYPEFAFMESTPAQVTTCSNPLSPPKKAYASSNHRTASTRHRGHPSLSSRSSYLSTTSAPLVGPPPKETITITITPSSSSSSSSSSNKKKPSNTKSSSSETIATTRSRPLSSYATDYSSSRKPPPPSSLLSSRFPASDDLPEGHQHQLRQQQYCLDEEEEHEIVFSSQLEEELNVQAELEEGEEEVDLEEQCQQRHPLRGDRPANIPSSKLDQGTTEDHATISNPVVEDDEAFALALQRSEYMEYRMRMANSLTGTRTTTSQEPMDDTILSATAAAAANPPLDQENDNESSSTKRRSTTRSPQDQQPRRSSEEVLPTTATATTRAAAPPPSLTLCSSDSVESLTTTTRQAPRKSARNTIPQTTSTTRQPLDGPLGNGMSSSSSFVVAIGAGSNHDGDEALARELQCSEYIVLQRLEYNAIHHMSGSPSSSGRAGVGNRPASLPTPPQGGSPFPSSPHHSTASDPTPLSGGPRRKSAMEYSATLPPPPPPFGSLLSRSSYHGPSSATTAPVPPPSGGRRLQAVMEAYARHASTHHSARQTTPGAHFFNSSSSDDDTVLDQEGGIDHQAPHPLPGMPSRLRPAPQDMAPLEHQLQRFNVKRQQHLQSQQQQQQPLRDNLFAIHRQGEIEEEPPRPGAFIVSGIAPGVVYPQTDNYRQGSSSSSASLQDATLENDNNDGNRKKSCGLLKRRMTFWIVTATCLIVFTVVMTVVCVGVFLRARDFHRVWQPRDES